MVEITQITVLTIFGQVVKTYRLGIGTYDLGLTDLPAGVYLLQLDQRTIQRIIKQ